MQHDDTHDTALQRSRESKFVRQVEANDLKWLMSSKQGRRLMWRWLGEAGVFRSSFTGNSETFFKEGKRSFGLFLLSEIGAHCPESHVEMMNEARAKTNE